MSIPQAENLLATNKIRDLLTTTTEEKFYHCVWCFDFANLDALGTLIEDTDRILNNQAIATFFTPLTVLSHRRVSIGALAIAARKNQKLWSILVLGVTDPTEGINEISFSVVAPDQVSVKNRAIEEVKKKGKQVTERTKYYVVDITEDFLQLLATRDLNLTEIVVTPEDEFLEVRASRVPDIAAQLQQN